jgi:hypothetical protein
MRASFRQVLWLLALSALTLGATGCVHHVHQHPTRVVTKSPPPWAPAHGHRHVHGERTLVFDVELGCYTVVGHGDHFFHRDHYYRWRAERWERAARARGPWRVVALDRLPSGLRGWHIRRHARHQQEVRERAREARRDQREAERRAERLEREQEERRAEQRREREREKRRAEAREREREARRAEAKEREREERRAAAKEREREERRAAKRQREQHELALREREARKLESNERRRAERRAAEKRKAGERKREAEEVDETEPAEDARHARRRAGKERGVRTDEKHHPSDQAPWHRQDR